MYRLFWLMLMNSSRVDHSNPKVVQQQI